MDAYELGKQEIYVDDFCGLMPPSYIEGKLRARKDLKTRKKAAKKEKGKNSKTKPGYHWVADRRAKGGGYWRKNKPKKAAAESVSAKKPGKKLTTALIAGGVAAAAAGAVAGAAASSSSKQTTPQEGDKKKRKKTLEDLEQEIATEQEIAQAEAKIKEQEKKAQKEKEENERELEKQVEKQLGKKQAVEGELEKLKQEVSKQRAAEVGESISEYTGQSEKRVPVIQNKTGDVDVKTTIESLGIGKPDSPIVDMNDVSASVRDKVNEKLETEYSQSLSELAKGHNRGYGNLIARLRKIEPGFSEKNHQRLIEKQNRTAAQIKMHSERYESAKGQLDKTIESTLEQLGNVANEAQRVGRPIDNETFATLQNGVNTEFFKGKLREISSDVKKLIPSNISKKINTEEISSEEAIKIIKEANAKLKAAGKKQLRFIEISKEQEGQTDSTQSKLSPEVLSFIRMLPSYRNTRRGAVI